MKHTYTILTLGCGSVRHLGPGGQVSEIQQMVPGVNHVPLIYINITDPIIREFTLI